MATTPPAHPSPPSGYSSTLGELSIRPTGRWFVIYKSAAACAVPIRSASHYGLTVGTDCDGTPQSAFDPRELSSLGHVGPPAIRFHENIHQIIATIATTDDYGVAPNCDGASKLLVCNSIGSSQCRNLAPARAGFYEDIHDTLGYI